jgi:cell division protease FtsH
MLFPQSGHSPTQRYPLAYSTFKQQVIADRIEQITLKGDAIEGKLRTPQPLGDAGEAGQWFTTRLPAFGDDTLLGLLEKNAVRVDVEEPGAGTGLALLAWLPWLLLMGLILLSLRRTTRDLGGVSGGLDKFLSPSARVPKVPDVSFADVAGQENAKREVQELVEYLQDPERFRRLGADVPRGVLLMGPPGTGKTMLAKALAGQAGVPFFSISGSAFIEVFVGVGAARVRSLFDSARRNAPCILFIDELDSVGRTRGTGLGGGHDEREQTLNQILAEMDGFEPHEAVIVLAATNRPDVLDPALLRPGRFDRHVTLELPDHKDRLAILRVHTRKTPLAADVQLDRIAGATPGFSGADLKNLVNEAAILAARDSAHQIDMRHFDAARDKVILGAERSLVIAPDERHRLAVHEAGHATVAFYLPNADPLYKVSIIPRGRALGGTQQLPEKERYTLPEDYLRDRLAVMLGGRAAEQEILGSISSGADDDIHQATALARAMVARWGMARDIGPVDLRESEEHPFLGREMAQPRRYSESSARAVDQAVRSMLQDAEQHAVLIIREHGAQLTQLVEALETEETLGRERIETCLGARPVRSLTIAAKGG